MTRNCLFALALTVGFSSACARDAPLPLKVLTDAATVSEVVDAAARRRDSGGTFEYDVDALASGNDARNASESDAQANPKDGPVDRASDDATAPRIDARPPDGGGGACSSTCVVGSSRCGTGGGVQMCAATGGCPGWTAEVACQAPKTCHASGSSASCGCPNGACTVGAKQCSNGLIQECTVQNGCPSWSAPNTCGNLQRCADPGAGKAACSCEITCTAGACGIPAFTFDGGSLQGAYVGEGLDNVKKPAISRQLNGEWAMSAEVVSPQDSLFTASFNFPLCLAGDSRKYQGRTVHARIQLVGPPLEEGAWHYVKVWLGRYEVQVGNVMLPVGVWHSLKFDAPESSDPATASEIILDVRAFNKSGPWTGTIWIDDVQLK